MTCSYLGYEHCVQFTGQHSAALAGDLWWSSDDLAAPTDARLGGGVTWLQSAAAHQHQGHGAGTERDVTATEATLHRGEAGRQSTGQPAGLSGQRRSCHLRSVAKTYFIILYCGKVSELYLIYDFFSQMER